MRELTIYDFEKLKYIYFRPCIFFILGNYSGGCKAMCRTLLEGVWLSGRRTPYIKGHQLTLVIARKTKTGKTPCAWCKMALTSHWYCDWLRIPRASSGIFSQSQHHPIGFCIKRKAINRKNNCSAGNITEYSVRRMDNSILFAAVRLVQSWKG